MEGLEFYEDSELTELLSAPFDIGKVMAGEPVEKTVYVKNTLDYPITFERFEVNGEGVSLKSSPKDLAPREAKKVVYVIDVSAAKLEPVVFENEVEYLITVS